MAEAVGQADPERKLMPGENPASQYLADADHWISVYEELLAFDNELLESLRRQLGNNGDGSELKIDVEKLDSRLSHLKEGLDFWRQRRDALKVNGF